MKKPDPRDRQIPALVLLAKRRKVRRNGRNEVVARETYAALILHFLALDDGVVLADELRVKVEKLLRPVFGPLDREIIPSGRGHGQKRWVNLMAWAKVRLRRTHSIYERCGLIVAPLEHVPRNLVRWAHRGRVEKVQKFKPGEHSLVKRTRRRRLDLE